MPPQDFFPPNESFKRAVEEATDEFLSDKIFDISWKKEFPYQTTFESLDGFGGSGGTLAQDQVTLTTGTTDGASADLFKQPEQQGYFTFSQRSRFKTSFLLDNSFGQTMYIDVGDIAAGGQGYGFKLVDGVLSGVADDGTTENLTTLITFTSGQDNQRYDIEARYLPGNKVIFFVSDPANSVLITEVGTGTSNLPSPSAVVNKKLLEFRTTLLTGAQNFATTDVNTSTDRITLTTAYVTGTAVQFSTSGTLPAGLSLSTTYYMINISSTVVEVAANLANALAGTPIIDITDQGSGTHTVTPNAKVLKFSIFDYFQTRNILH